MIKVIKIEGMSCDHCAKKIENSLLAIENIIDVKINLSKKTVIIEAKNNIGDQILKETIEKMDYKVIAIKEV